METPEDEIRPCFACLPLSSQASSRSEESRCDYRPVSESDPEKIHELHSTTSLSVKLALFRSKSSQYCYQFRLRPDKADRSLHRPADLESNFR